MTRENQDKIVLDRLVSFMDKDTFAVYNSLTNNTFEITDPRFAAAFARYAGSRSKFSTCTKRGSGGLRNMLGNKKKKVFL